MLTNIQHLIRMHADEIKRAQQQTLKLMNKELTSGNVTSRLVILESIGKHVSLHTWSQEYVRSSPAKFISFSHHSYRIKMELRFHLLTKNEVQRNLYVANFNKICQTQFQSRICLRFLQILRMPTLIDFNFFLINIFCSFTETLSNTVGFHRVMVSTNLSSKW